MLSFLPEHQLLTEPSSPRGDSGGISDRKTTHYPHRTITSYWFMRFIKNQTMLHLVYLSSQPNQSPSLSDTMPHTLVYPSVEAMLLSKGVNSGVSLTSCCYHLLLYVTPLLWPSNKMFFFSSSLSLTPNFPDMKLRFLSLFSAVAMIDHNILSM